MTKRELLKWLEAKRNRTLMELSSKYNKANAELVNQAIVDSGLPPVADQMEALIDQVLALWSGWKEQRTDSDEFSFKRYSHVAGNLSKYSNAKGAALRVLACDEFTVQTTAMVKLENEYQATREKTTNNYDNVIAVVESMPKAAMATAYLKELGFDLTEIEPPKQPVTALTVKIDRNYLFLKKAA